jgi:hypothetical protein
MNKQSKFNLNANVLIIISILVTLYYTFTIINPIINSIIKNTDDLEVSDNISTIKDFFK